MALPYSTSLAGRPQPFAWAWGAGIFFHVALVLLAIVLSLWQPPRIEAGQKPIAAKLVRLGKPRDAKLLPRKEASPPPSAPPPSKAAPTPPSPAAKPAAPSAAAAAAPSPAPPSSDERRTKLDDIMKKFKATAAVAGDEEPEGQADGDPDGDAAKAEEGERWLALVKKRVDDAYEVPSTISEADRVSLRAVVRIVVKRNGEIAKADVITPSGNGSFDNALLGAVQRVRLLPPPPENLAASLATEGIDLVFRAAGR